MCGSLINIGLRREDLFNPPPESNCKTVFTGSEDPRGLWGCGGRRGGRERHVSGWTERGRTTRVDPGGGRRPNLTGPRRSHGSTSRAWEAGSLLLEWEGNNSGNRWCRRKGTRVPPETGSRTDTTPLTPVNQTDTFRTGTHPPSHVPKLEVPYVGVTGHLSPGPGHWNLQRLVQEFVLR